MSLTLPYSVTHRGAGKEERAEGMRKEQVREETQKRDRGTP